MLRQLNESSNQEKEILFPSLDKKLQIKNKYLESNLQLKQNLVTTKFKKRKAFISNQTILYFQNIFSSLFKLYFSISLIISISSRLSHNCNRKLQMPYSEITMEIIGNIGEQRIITSDFCPDEIYLNENIISYGSCMINLENEGNITIKLIWFDQLTTFAKMFYELNNIIDYLSFP